MVPPPLCGCPPHSWRGWLDRGECGHALSGSGDACSTGEAPRTLISPRGPGPAKSLGQKRELASQRARPPSPSAPLLGLPREAWPPARTDTGGREGRGDSSQAADSLARGPQAQAQASPRLRGKHRHQPRDGAEERPRRGLARRAPASPELQTGPAVPAGRRQPCTGPRPTPPHQGLQERSGGTLTPTLYLAPDLGHDRLTESF